jgi:hypothetical protein
MTRLTLVAACGLMLCSGCFSATSYSAPDGATLAPSTRLTPEQQQGRWACSGWDFVLSGATLHELNQGIALDDGLPSVDGNTVYHYKIGGLTFMFSIPKDRKQPALIAYSGTVVLSRMSISQTSPTEISDRQNAFSNSFKGAAECPSAPPVTVW